jgi:hypothetical protein
MAEDPTLDTAARVRGDSLGWEVLLVRYAGGCPVKPGEVVGDEDVPGDALGPVADVKRALSAALPDLEWGYPDRGGVRRGGLRFDFNVHLYPECPDVLLSVQGQGDPLPVVVQVCRSNGWVAVDLTTWRVLDLDDPSRDGWLRVKDAIHRNRGKQPPWKDQEPAGPAGGKRTNGRWED